MTLAGALGVVVVVVIVASDSSPWGPAMGQDRWTSSLGSPASPLPSQPRPSLQVKGRGHKEIRANPTAYDSPISTSRPPLLERQPFLSPDEGLDSRGWRKGMEMASMCGSDG